MPEAAKALDLEIQNTQRRPIAVARKIRPRSIDKTVAADTTDLVDSLKRIGIEEIKRQENPWSLAFAGHGVVVD